MPSIISKICKLSTIEKLELAINVGITIVSVYNSINVLNRQKPANIRDWFDEQIQIGKEPIIILNPEYVRK